MRHSRGPGLDLDRDPGQGQEAGRYLDQDQEVVAGMVLDFALGFSAFCLIKIFAS